MEVFNWFKTTLTATDLFHIQQILTEVIKMDPVVQKLSEQVASLQTVITTGIADLTAKIHELESKPVGENICEDTMGLLVQMSAQVDAMKTAIQTAYTVT